MQIARGMQGNATGTYDSGCYVPGECRGMQGERTIVGATCQGNAGECRGGGREMYGSL